ncbi:MFS transporter [Candidatus Clostridium radicumherbarum]|uniref:MFS transporter n=1 Tax=Candidatus Clostridium radicumherbarum TaxID=3381662 RepID=A0ABW8TX77_9CLOT
MNIKLLKKKDLSLLMTGKLTSLLGSGIQSFALSLYVLRLTGSGIKFAATLVISIIPQLILGPIAGVFVDWFDRKRILVYLDLAAGIVVSLYAFVFIANGGLTLGSVYSLVIILSIINVLFQPAVSTVIPAIIDREELVDANGINSFFSSIGNLLSPAIAGVLFGLYGLFPILIINCLSFFASSICEVFIKIPKLNRNIQKLSFKKFSEDFSEGLSFIKHKDLIIMLMIIALIANFAADPIFSVGFAFISKQVLKVTDFQYGMIESIFVVSMLFSPFICSKIVKRYEISRVAFWSFLLVGVFVGTLSIVPAQFFVKLFNTNIVPYIAMLCIVFIIGIFSTISNICLGTLFQKEVPIEMMGRVGTLLNTVSMAAVPLGRFVFGFLFDKLSPNLCILISSLLMLSTMIYFSNKLLKPSIGKVVKESVTA